MSSLYQKTYQAARDKKTDSLMNLMKSLAAIDNFINNSSNYPNSFSGSSVINQTPTRFVVRIP